MWDVSGVSGDGWSNGVGDDLLHSELLRLKSPLQHPIIIGGVRCGLITHRCNQKASTRISPHTARAFGAVSALVTSHSRIIHGVVWPHRSPLTTFRSRHMDMYVATGRQRFNLTEKFSYLLVQK